MSPAEQGQAGSIPLLQGVETPIITPLAEGQTLPTWDSDKEAVAGAVTGVTMATNTAGSGLVLLPLLAWASPKLLPHKGMSLEVLSVHSGCSTGIWGTPETLEQPLGISAVPWLSLTEAQLPHTHTDPGVRALPAGLSLLCHSFCAQNSVLCALCALCTPSLTQTLLGGALTHWEGSRDPSAIMSHTLHISELPHPGFVTSQSHTSGARSPQSPGDVSEAAAPWEGGRLSPTPQPGTAADTGH